MDKAALNLIDCKVGEKIKQARSLKGFTQTKLGKALGITFQQVQKYENGKNRVSASRLYHIAQILDCPISFFFEEPDQDWPEGPNKNLSKWIALYDKTSPEIRNILYRVVSTLSGDFRENRQPNGEGKEARH